MVGAFLHQYSRTCTQKYLIIEITSNYFQPTASRPTTSAQPLPVRPLQPNRLLSTAASSAVPSRPLSVRAQPPDHLSSKSFTMTTSARLSHLVPKQSFIFHRLHRGQNAFAQSAPPKPTRRPYSPPPTGSAPQCFS